MIIGLLEISFSIPEARSLKDKRSVIRSIRDRILNEVNVSVAEIGRQDEWRFCEMAFVTVAQQGEIVEKRLSSIQNKLSMNPMIVITGIESSRF